MSHGVGVGISIPVISTLGVPSTHMVSHNPITPVPEDLVPPSDL